MNLHVPQSVEAATELREIAAVPKQLISPRLSTPLISVVQDTLVGVNRLTRPTEFFTRREFMNLLVHSKRWDGRVPPPAKTDPVPMWSGQQVVSSLLPAVHLAMGNKVWDETTGVGDPNYVVIKNGAILKGILDGNIFDKALIHILYNDFSPEMTVDFLDGLQAVVATYLQNSGFSVGLSDLVADTGTLDIIAKSSSELKKRLESLQLQVHMGLFENTSGRTNEEEFESKVFQTLDKARDEAGKTGLQSLTATNRMINMVRCGSKGSDTNIAQMIALLGQQAIEGKRINYGFQDRTLPHFKRYDDGADARGFIESSFVKGLTPAEFFFHAMTGREGLIDTAVKTASSGYMQRQLVKTMEDLMTYHDASVRDAGGIIVQYAYGDDGTSATKIENQPIGLGSMSDADIRARFTVEDVAPEKSQAYLTEIMEDRDILVNNVWGGRVGKTVQSAVHLPRLIANGVQQLELVPGKGTPVPSAHVLDTIGRIQQRTRPDNRLWGALLRFHLNPRDLQALGYTRAAFDWLAEQIVVKHMKSWVAPGEMAGIISAQSLGEPTTQMCAVKETWISVKNLKNTSQVFTGQVGTFINNLMMEREGELKYVGDDKCLLGLENEWAIMGVSNDEKASWMPISCVSRHPANGGLVKVTTKSGRSTTQTLSHSFLRRTTNGIAEIKGSDLRVGMRIPVAYRIPESPDALTTYNGFALTKDFGWLVGIYLADGSFSGNTVKITKIHPVVEARIRALAAVYGWDVAVRTYAGQYGPFKETNIKSKELRDTLMEMCNTGSYDKCINTPIFHANREFIAGVLSGYFDGDGNVNAPRQQIRAGSRSEELIRGVARLLAFCGVFASIKEETSVRFPDQTMYTVNVIRKHAEQFQNVVGLYLPEKAEALAKIVEYNKRDDAHSTREDLDLIPELGDVIAETGRLLKMPGQSRNYGRFGSDRVNPKTVIGRRTLETYISEFREMMAIHVDGEVAEQVKTNMAILESAVTSDVIWDEIVELEVSPDPHEMVYDFTVPGNDSFMVDDNIFVHNTLNSVDWDTEIIIACDGRIQTPKIGEFIDNYITTCDDSRIQRLPNDQLYVALDDSHEWTALSPDENGKMMWTKLEAITKHPVINKDGTNTILEVELESGRVVKATKALSFLRFEKDKLVPCNGSDLLIGDEIPVVNSFASSQIGTISNISLREVLPAKEWLYGTEVHKALTAMRTADAAGNRHWFSHANGKEFTVPYTRSDAFRDAFTGGKNMHAASICEGNVYPKKLWTKCTQIPESIPLDRAFGFFCGAYVAEGSTSPTQIQITNNDDTYLAPIRTLLDSWSIGHHTVSVDKEIRKTGIKGHTQSLIIHSTLLTAAMKAMFGRISYEKTLPAWVLQAPDDFIRGLIDGYFSGDGYMGKDNRIAVGSVSKGLLERIAAILSSYGIFSTISSYMPDLRKFDSVSRQYKLEIPVAYSYLFAQLFTMTIGYKQDTLNTYVGAKRESKWAAFNEVILDRVASIKEVNPKGDRVYDLTVAVTKNFTCLNGIASRDTFHLSGVAAKSGMTRGVPRLNELLKVTQNPKATSLTISLREDIRNSKEEARRLAQELEFTLLKDLVTVCRIYYDPRDEASLIAEDAEWLSFFAEFEQSANVDPATRSPWILRLELDREKMFNKNITMEEIHYVLKRAGELEVAYTDHNTTKMVFRVRLIIGKTKDPLDDLTLVKQMQHRLLTQTLIRGLPGLRSVSFRKTSRDTNDEVFEKNPAKDNKYEVTQPFVLDTFGTNFLDVMIHPDVDGLRLISNHIHDINENLGIEAARQILFREIFTLFEQAAPVNYRHVAVLCDAICNRGRMMSADRIGVNKKTKIGPLAKASFEQTENIMLRAALFGEMDPVTGVSASIMTGQPIRGGTTFSQVLLDEEALKELIATAPPPRKTVERAPGIAQEEVERLLESKEAVGCRQEDLRIPAALPPMEPGVQPEAELPDLEIQLVD
jgi:DNA-directed RNA polymerase beta' subunit